MTDTTTQNVKRDRQITGIGHSDGSAFGLALAILLALGIKDTVELNKHLDGGDFCSVTDDAPLNGIETPELYPDRVLLLGEGTLLITDGANELSVGGVYTDEVMPGGIEPAAAEEGERDEAAEQEAVEAEPKPPLPTLA